MPLSLSSYTVLSYLMTVDRDFDLHIFNYLKLSKANISIIYIEQNLVQL